MADNIQIVGDILGVQTLSRYNEDDVRLISSNQIQEDFGNAGDYIEYFVSDAGGNVLNANYSYTNIKSPSTSFVNDNGTLPVIEIDPISDLKNLGYSSGEFNVQYNFFNNRISSPNAELFLKEISADRTEIRVGSTVLTNEQIESGSLALINEYSSSAYFTDYLINFGSNKQVVAVNVALNKVDSGYEILFKLYQPLPLDIQEKSSLWVVDEKVTPYIFNINLDKLITLPAGPKLRGPNFDIDIPNQNNVATSYQTYTGLVNSFQSLTTSSYQQLLSLITSQSIDINVDYSDRNNFVFFSSAKSRINNFYTKVKEIENLKNNISVYTALTSSRPNLINDLNSATASINTLISQFDGYEYYLYFESSSYTWPKTSTTLPYTLATTASAANWYNLTTGSAATYDEDNSNYIINTLPNFVKDDENNAQYITFLNMIGHYFDNIWIYLQAVTDINLANNNLEKGVSKDLVYTVLQSLGSKLYNPYGDSNNVNFLIGQSGSANFDNNFTATGSYLNTIPRKDLLAETYKRIYHNLPLLLKTKGTAYGLQTLVSTFGITGSILNVKEYGGDSKNTTLDEFNNNKIRIVPNTITGSVLSPFISLQTPATASSLFRTNDLHYVDISFSPETQIDTYASASIVAANPTWSIDDYIGDPRQTYSTSYTDLDVQKRTYYNFTSSYMDYAGFIRLIQFFDNSLFKMLKDYVPARANLSTGITISSPVLERNKWVIANPSSTSEIEVEDGTISGPKILSEYTNLYSGLTGSKVAYYDGNLTGSYINVYSYFESSSVNPYLFPTGSIDTNKFLHSDFNVLINNVSQSVLSRVRQDIQFIPGTTQSILTKAELQDSYESLQTHQLSRYEGVKLSSLYYNTYTSASSDYEGDISFGKTAVIDHNVIKLGIFSEVVANRFLPKRNNAVLKYLVNKDGELTELNLRNKHWEEIQNTFVAGETGSISQFNNQLYGNQKTTDGEKVIFNSGYSYSPILYFPSCSGTSGYTNISFQNQGNSSAYLATAQNLSSSYFVSGSSPLGFPVSGGNGGAINNIFNSPTETYTYYTPGNFNAPCTYSVSETGQYRVYANMSMNITMASSQSATWSLEMYSGSTLIDSNTVSAYFGNVSVPCYYWRIYNEAMDLLFYTYTNCLTGVTSGRIKLNPGDNIQVCSRYAPNIEEGTGTVVPEGPCGSYSEPGSLDQTLTFTIDRGYNNTSYHSAISGDKIHFRLKLVNITAPYTASLTNGSLSIGSLALSTGYSVVGCSPTGYIASADTASITFSNAVSSFYNNNYLFVPNPLSGSTSALYDDYGDVDYTFDPKPNDILVVHLTDNSVVEYVVTTVSLSDTTGKLTLNLNTPLSTSAKANLISGTYGKFLLLSRRPDETNVILNFIKRDGKTSYGFLIPETISSTVLANIDTITKEVKQKLLNDQPIINDVNGGTFGP